MVDLISRADAIRWVKTECNQYGKPTLDYDSGLKVIEHLKKMPSELPAAEAEWIPCSERLPEDGVAVLITTENEEVYIDQVITDPFKERYFQSNTAYDNFQVTAWMPLPKPYREDGE